MEQGGGQGTSSIDAHRNAFSKRLNNKKGKFKKGKFKIPLQHWRALNWLEKRHYRQFSSSDKMLWHLKNGEKIEKRIRAEKELRKEQRKEKKAREPVSGAQEKCETQT